MQQLLEKKTEKTALNLSMRYVSIEYSKLSRIYSTQKVFLASFLKKSFSVEALLDLGLTNFLPIFLVVYILIL